jgi:hypothetical protein
VCCCGRKLSISNFWSFGITLDIDGLVLPCVLELYLMRIKNPLCGCIGVICLYRSFSVCVCTYTSKRSVVYLLVVFLYVLYWYAFVYQSFAYGAVPCFLEMDFVWC